VGSGDISDLLQTRHPNGRACHFGNPPHGGDGGGGANQNTNKDNNKDNKPVGIGTATVQCQHFGTHWHEPLVAHIFFFLDVPTTKMRISNCLLAFLPSQVIPLALTVEYSTTHGAAQQEQKRQQEEKVVVVVVVAPRKIGILGNFHQRSIPESTLLFLQYPIESIGLSLWKTNTNTKTKQGAASRNVGTVVLYCSTVL
jgi:hypothetical protein